MATVYPTVYPSDMPPMLARQEPSSSKTRRFLEALAGGLQIPRWLGSDPLSGGLVVGS